MKNNCFEKDPFNYERNDGKIPDFTTKANNESSKN